jgi:ATP-binding cassette subfamily B protein/subfamily B ATP-binding cassette protein MsbA
LDNEDHIEEAQDAGPLPDVAAGANRGRVTFDCVTFGYRSGVAVLKEIDFTIEAGETVALIGRTGSGKTTLASLIPRFFDPWEGRVAFDGADLRGLQLDAVRRSVAMVLQQPFLMPMTIAENIAYSRPGATLEQVIDAAKAANADGFIRRLDSGYDTLVGEYGATLSGGERQRLAIARAILRDAPIVILDEPTSALDTEAELSVMRAIEKLTRDRTTIVIAHRLSTARLADRLLVLDNGKIVEQGAHSELLRRGGIYARYWYAQTIPTSAESST